MKLGLLESSQDSFDVVFVVGDTPRDIFHGHEAGASVLAVSTGSYSLAELESYGPELAVPDLAETEAILEFFRSAELAGIGE